MRYKNTVKILVLSPVYQHDTSRKTKNILLLINSLINILYLSFRESQVYNI